MTAQRFEVRSGDGTRLAGYQWSPEGEAPPNVLLIHGGFEHLGRYEFVANRLVASGYRVTGVDLRGHGESDGARGHVESWSDYVADCAAARSRISGPYQIVGHSMGALIALDYMLTHPGEIRGAVLSGPLLGLPDDAPRLKVLASRILARLAPRVSLDANVDSKAISRDPAVVEAYEQDPLVFKTLSPLWLRSMQRAVERVFEAAPRYTIPVFVPYGTADRVVPVSQIERMFAVYGGSVELRPWDGLFHEVFNEPEREQVLDEVIAWLDQHREATDA